MTPQEKAKELVDKYLTMENTLNIIDLPYLEMSKQCALIAVKEIYELNLIPGQYPDVITFDYKNKTSYFSYWEEVMEEIQKL